MRWKTNRFGGVLLESECGNIAINGGGTLAELEDAYIVDGKAPAAMIVTCEHIHRSRNAVIFCREHRLPLITTAACAERLNPAGIRTHLLTVPGNRFFLRWGLGVHFVPVRYDSAAPFGLILHDGEALCGMIPDGRIYPRTAELLMDCDAIILGNRLAVPADATAALERRLRCVCHSQAELNEVFRNYTGKIIYL